MLRVALLCFSLALAGCSLIVDAKANQSSDGGLDGGAGSSLCESGVRDGVRGGEEECDDGNDSDTDGCLNNCRFARCGDGVVRKFIESCDDPTPGSECSAECVSCDFGPDASAMLGSACYAVNEQTLRWGDARNRCWGLDAELAILDTFNSTVDVASALSLDSANTYWIGLALDQGIWRWMAGFDGPATPLWDSGEPMTTDVGEAPRGFLRASNNAWGSRRAINMDSASICMRAPTNHIRNPNNNHYYALNTIGTSQFGFGTYDGLSNDCKAMGAHLVTINTTDELAFLMTEFSGETFWTDLRDRDQNGTPEWGTGEPYDSSVAGSEPLGNECGELNATTGTIQATPCGNNGRKWMCEWD